MVANTPTYGLKLKTDGCPMSTEMTDLHVFDRLFRDLIGHGYVPERDIIVTKDGKPMTADEYSTDTLRAGINKL